MKNNLNDIGDAIRRIEKLEKAVFGLQKKGTKPRNAVATDTLASKLLSLRGNGFFKLPKTAPEAHAKLQITYPCESTRVAVELFRLRKKGELRITSKTLGGKKLKAYVG